MARAHRAHGQLTAHFTELSPSHAAQYVHDLWVYDRGAKWEDFLARARALHGEHAHLALSVLARTYFVKDEVFIAHLMVSPLRAMADEGLYGDIGSSYRKTFIIRPSFVVAGRKIEFDLSPKIWMLKVMRHMRVLRKLMPEWHSREREIGREIRERLGRPGIARPEIQKLANIKGYRQVRYSKWGKLNA